MGKDRILQLQGKRGRTSATWVWIVASLLSKKKNLALLLLLVHHNLGRSQSELKQLLSQPYRNASLPASSFMVCWNPSRTCVGPISSVLQERLPPWPRHWSSWVSCCQVSGSKLGPCEKVLTLGLGRWQETSMEGPGGTSCLHSSETWAWGVVWSGYVWWGVSHRPSPWSLVLLVVVCMWTKDRLFLRDQPFKTRWMLSTQTFLSLRWILGALKSWWFFVFFFYPSRQWIKELACFLFLPFDLKETKLL